MTKIQNTIEMFFKIKRLFLYEYSDYEWLLFVFLEILTVFDLDYSLFDKIRCFLSIGLFLYKRYHEMVDANLLFIRLISKEYVCTLLMQILRCLSEK